MINLDVDEIQKINFPDAPRSGEKNVVQVVFKNDQVQVYKGPEFAEAIEILKHRIIPPTA
jgi:hypothetical protein